MTLAISTYSKEFSPGERRSIPVRGNYIRGMSGTLPYNVRLDDAAPAKFQTGVAYDTQGQVFESVEIHNTSGTTQVIEIAVALGRIEDNRLVGNVDISGGIRLAGSTGASYGAASVGTSAVEIVPASTGRVSVLIQNTGAAAVYVGTDASVTAANGIIIGAGGSAELTVQTAVYAVASAGTLDVRYLEESL